MKINKIGQLTEIQVDTIGGGNWLTQSYPTFFHTFVERKILGKEESADDWKEVTASERATIEKADAEFIPPSKEELECWKLAWNVYGSYDETTGYCTIDDVKLTPNETRQAYAASGRPYSREVISTHFCGYTGKGLFPIRVYNVGSSITATSAFAFSRNLEVVRLCDPAFRDVVNGVIRGGTIWRDCNKLREVRGSMIYEGGATPFYNSPLIEEFRFKTLESINLSQNLKVSDASLDFLAIESQPSKGVQIVLHPDTYARWYTPTEHAPLNLVDYITKGSSNFRVENGKLILKPSNIDTHFRVYTLKTLKADAQKAAKITIEFDVEGLEEGKSISFTINNTSLPNERITCQNGRNHIVINVGNMNTKGNCLLFDDVSDRLLQDSEVIFSNFKVCFGERENLDDAVSYSSLTAEQKTEAIRQAMFDLAAEKKIMFTTTQ